MRNNSYRLLGILPFFFAFLLFNGCKKAQDKSAQYPENINKHPLENLFFATADSVPATVKKVSAYLLKRSDKSEIVTSVIDAIGLPAWDKAVIIEAKASKTAIGLRAAPLDTSYLFVPIVPQGTEEVEGAFVCKIVGDSVSVLLVNEKNYKEYGFDASKPRNAHHLVSLMMFLQAKAFGTECFVLNDGRLFENNSAAVDSSGKRFIYIGNKAANNNRQHKALFAADYIIETTICYYTNNTNRISSKGAIAASVLVPCIKTYEWIPAGGGSSGSYDPGMGPGGGSGGGGSSSTASISITQYFQQTLGLTSSQLIILNAFPQLSEECFNYLQITDGQLTYEDQKKLVASHILNLKPNPLYLEYCESVSVQNAQSQGKYYPWFRYNTLFSSNSVLANNIQKLKLDAKQAYYLLNNSNINTDIVNHLIENNYSIESVISTKHVINEFQSNALVDFGGTMHVSYVQGNVTSCCPVQYIAYINAKAAMIQLENPNWSYMRCYLAAHLEIIHDLLDIIGLVPVVGEVADVANGVIYTIQGDGINASLSFAATIPIGGWAAAGVKWARKGITLSSGAKTALNWYKRADGFISFGKPNSSQFRKLLGLPNGDPRQAHHIIPWEVADDVTQEVIQKAASAKFPFHVQDVLNGVPLTATQHLGSHPEYTKRVKAELVKIKTKHGANLTPEIAYQEIVDLTNRIKQAILANPNISIESIIF